MLKKWLKLYDVTVMICKKKKKKGNVINFLPAVSSLARAPFNF